jgi:hypothetical protein
MALYPSANNRWTSISLSIKISILYLPQKADVAVSLANVNFLADNWQLLPSSVFFGLDMNIPQFPELNLRRV